MNPTLWLELRLLLRFRSRKFWIVSALFVLVLFVFSFAVNAMAGHSGDASNALLGVDSFLLLALLLLIAGVTGAGRISQEREQRTLAGHLNTPIPIASIIRGKLFGTWAYCGWFLLLALPFFLWIGLKDGAAWGKIASLLPVIALSSMTVGALGIGFSGIFRRSLVSSLATGLFLLLWIAALPLLGFVHQIHLILDGSMPSPTPLANALFFAHNPFRVLMLVSHIDPSASPSPLWLYAYVLGVWATLSLLAFYAAVRSLRTGLFDRN